MFRSIKELSPKWKDFWRAFLITFVLDGVLCLFILSGMK